jgi:sec-independent protein translocase protein TatA
MTIANLFGALEGPELLIILVIVLLLFGGSKLPELARSLGHAKREFHDATTSTPPADSEPTEATPDTVTIARDELEKLRSAAEHRPAGPDGFPHTN